MYAIDAIILWQETGLTWTGVLRDIPHDPAAFVIYLLTAVCAWVIWKGSRGKPDQTGDHKETEEAGPAGPRP